MNNEKKDPKFKKWKRGVNVEKMGDELSRYLTLKGLCEDQQKLIKSLFLEIGFLKSELAEANDIKEMWRNKYIKLKDNEDLGEL